MPPQPLTTASRIPIRNPGLDAARTFAMVAMVFGHSADVLLSTAVRALPSLQTYWTFRGFTAPLFLMVSGWALWSSTTGASPAGDGAAEAPRFCCCACAADASSTNTRLSSATPPRS